MIVSDGERSIEEVERHLKYLLVEVREEGNDFDVFEVEKMFEMVEHHYRWAGSNECANRHEGRKQAIRYRGLIVSLLILLFALSIDPPEGTYMEELTGPFTLLLVNNLEILSVGLALFVLTVLLIDKLT